MAYLEFVPTKPLYHYTSEAGFRGMVQSRNVWVSDLQASNDPRDIQLGLQTVEKITREIGEREYSIQNSKVLAALTAKLKRYFESARCYTACFTPHGDNLNMWREYGNGGKGYAIGFKPRAITDMHGRIYKVRYVDDASYEDIYNLVSEVVKPIEIYGGSIFKDAAMELEIGSTLISIVNSLKHYSWEYEDEVRLTFASGDDRPPSKTPVSISPDGREKQWKKFQTRRSGDQDIKYHSLRFGKYGNQGYDPRESLYEIVSGPNAVLTESDVRQILLDGGFSNFKIKKSSCAFR